MTTAQANAHRVGEGAAIVGIWDVAVTVVNCQTGAVLRNVRSVQMYQADGAFSETTSLGTRGSSIGYWVHQEGQNYSANYFFFRYNPDGSFASIAKAANTITVSPDSNQFSVTATIQDYDANNNLLSTGLRHADSQKAVNHPRATSGHWPRGEAASGGLRMWPHGSLVVGRAFGQAHRLT